MIQSNENRVLDMILVHEGGYSNDPQDPGGATMKGVTQRTYDAYRSRKGLAPRSVKLMEDDELREIYDQQYWDAVKADSIPSGVDYVVMDGAVNSGPKQSVIWLQRALGPTYKGSIDGMMGLQTIQAIQEFANDDLLVDRICDRRMAFLRALKTWKRFGKGWTSRVNDVRKVGKAWATGQTAPTIVAADNSNQKALASDAKQAPSTAISDAATGAGAGGAGLTGTVQQLQDQLTPISYGNDFITKVVVVLGIISAALMIGGIAYGYYQRAQAKKLADALN